MVLTAHFFFPAGLNILRLSSFLAIEPKVSPLKKSLYISLMISASFSTTLGIPSSPFSKPKKLL